MRACTHALPLSASIRVHLRFPPSAAVDKTHDDSDRAFWLRSAGTKPLQVAAQIRAVLGERLYFTFLFETFTERTGPDRRAYTPAQAALVRANFKALLTTNYDSGLLEARRVLRPEVRDTGFSFSDVMLTQIADEVLWQTVRQAYLLSKDCPTLRTQRQNAKHQVRNAAYGPSQ